MPEMIDVIGGEVISSDWGNDIRDRSIQRYANLAERSATHPTPVDGDLAFMEDTGLVYVYYASAWQRIGALEEVDNSVGTSATTTTSYTSMVTVSVTIPAHWASWKAHAIATWQYGLGVAGEVVTNFKLNIDGTEGATTTVEATGVIGSSTLQFRRTGMTTTGSRGIALFGKHTGAVAVSVDQVYLYVRAVRTS